jgi:hypothetical protein
LPIASEQVHDEDGHVGALGLFENGLNGRVHGEAAVA